MKFSAIILSLGFAALAAAQARNSTVVSSSVAAPTQTTSYSPQVAACLGKCKESDVTCRAQCLGSAAPNDASANATNECVGKCPQGDGSPAATEQYTKCVTSCINTIYLSTSAAAPAATGSSGSGSGSGSGGNSGNPTSGGNPSGTGSGADASSAPNAGSSVQVGGSFLALFGIAAGILAL